MPARRAATAPVESARQRDLNFYWWGQTTSAFGSVFTAIAMPVIAVAYLGASPGQVGLMSAAAVVPKLLFGLPAGTLADRVARPRRMLMALDALCALTVATVALGVENHVATVGWLVALAAADGCMTVLLEVVYFIHLRQLTDADGIGGLRARLQAGQYAAGVIGRLLAGPTIVVLGAAAALCVDAVSYVLSLAALLCMRPVAALPRKPAPGSTGAVGGALRGMGAGIRLFLGDAFRRTLLVFLFVPGVAAAGVGALTGPFLLRVVKVPTEAYGLLFAASGLMGLAGSVLAGRLLRAGRDPRMVTLASLTAGTVCALLLPLAFGPLPVAAGFAALGISLPVLFGAVANVGLSPVILGDAAEDAVGRTVAVLQLFGAVSGLVGALAGGVLGDWIGVRRAMWALDAGVLVAIALCLPPAVRAVRQGREVSATCGRPGSRESTRSDPRAGIGMPEKDRAPAVRTER